MIRTQEESLNCDGQREDMKILNRWISEENLMDLKISNANFTWIGRQGKRSRLDRAIINPKTSLSGNWKVTAVPRRNSDHKGLILQQEELNWGPKPFRIFNIWLKEKLLIDMIKEKLKDKLQNGKDLQDNLRAVKQVTRNWNQEFNGNIFKKLQEAEEELAKQEEAGRIDSCTEAIKQKIEDLQLIRDSMVRQQSRMKWLKEGDRNTKFFHQAIQKRRIKNQIVKLWWKGKNHKHTL